MQNRYVGDIGDYAKYSLLRALSRGHKLGLSWYLYPDEDSGDGGHIGYLLRPDKWREPDPVTFYILRKIVGDAFDEIHKQQVRSVAAIEESGLLGTSTVFWRKTTVPEGCRGGEALERHREEWFRGSAESLRGRDIVFADPDNGLRKREQFEPRRCRSGKSICEEEALCLAEDGRPVVVYHHNTMFRGGHDAEVRHWQRRLGRRLEGRVRAVRWRPFSPRTFFILNCTDELRGRAKQWCEVWKRPTQVYFEDYPAELDKPK